MKMRLPDGKGQAIYDAMERGETELTTFPTHISISPSIRCNLKCVMCAQRSCKSLVDRIELVDGLSARLFDEMKERGHDVHMVRLSGGEPFFIKETVEFLEWVADKKPGFELDIATNGTLIDHDLLTRLPMGLLKMSVNARHETTWRRLCQGTSDEFARLQESLRWLKGKRYVRLSYAVMRGNVLELPEAMRLYNAEQGHRFAPRIVCAAPKSEVMLKSAEVDELQRAKEAVQEAMEYATDQPTRASTELLLRWIGTTIAKKIKTKTSGPRCDVCHERVEFVVGGRHGNQRICPSCQSRARTRSVAHWISSRVASYQNVLEIGQVLSLAPLYLRKRWAFTILDKRKVIGTCVLSYTGDVVDLPYKDEVFSLVAALNVLEHVEDDRKAYAELVRVLKPGGLLVVQVPMIAGLTEEFGECRPDEYNHWRNPGDDYIERLLRDDVTVEFVTERAGRELSREERFFVVRKRNEPGA
jgi:MoaA/NifB/PqqE/SkfB family radical SAM enzyme